MTLRKNVLWNVFGNIFYLGVQWFITILVTRKTGFKDTGVLSLAMSISATFQTIAFFGVRNYQVSDIESKYSDSDYVMARGITCTLALAFCVVFTLINSYTFYQSVAIICFMLFRLSDGFSDVLHGVSQKRGRLDYAGKGFFYKGIVVFIAFIFGYYVFKELNIALSFMSIGAFLITFCYDFKQAMGLSSFIISKDWKTSFHLLNETKTLCCCLFLQSAISTTPKYILEKLCDAATLGAYSSIFAPALLIQAAAGYIYVPFIGIFSEFYQNHNVINFKRLFLQILICILCIGLLTFFCAQIIGEKVLIFVFGSAITEYIFLLQPILLCTFSNAILAFLCMLSVVIRDLHGQLAACLLGMIICMIATILMISLFGSNGASYGLLCGNLIAGMIIFIRIARKVKGDI